MKKAGLRTFLLAGILFSTLSAQELVWEQQEGALARWEQVRHSGNTVLVAGNGAVQKLDAGTGTVLWTHTGMSLSEAHDLTPYSGGVLVSGTYNDGSATHFAVHALSPSGSPLWSYVRPASNVYSGDDDTAYAVVECGGVVIALGKVETNLNDTLLVVGLDPSTGSVLWEFTDVSPATNAARDGVCLPGGDVIIAAVFQDTAYAYRLTPSGTRVWKQSLGHEVLVENKVLGVGLTPSGNAVVVGTEWHGGLTYRMFATAINPSGTILWDDLHASDFRAEAFAIQDTLIYAVGNAGSDYTAPGMVVALNTNGSQRWSRTPYSGIRFHGAAADTFGNLFAVGENPGTYDTTGFVIAFSPTGRKLYHDFLYGPVGEGAWDVTAVGSDPVIAGATYTTGRIGSVARFHLLPYLVLDSLTRDDGGDRLPNTEGDPATGNLFLQWHWHIEGGQGNLNVTSPAQYAPNSPSWTPPPPSPALPRATP
jgi:outer membrane protein assembly factor BamB